MAVVLADIKAAIVAAQNAADRDAAATQMAQVIFDAVTSGDVVVPGGSSAGTYSVT